MIYFSNIIAIFLIKFCTFAIGLYLLDQCFHRYTCSFKITESAAYAVQSVVKSTMTYLYKSGHWVG